MSFPQRCKLCGRRDKFSFQVSDDVWRAVLPQEYHNRVVCLGCFDAFASQKGVDYTHALEADIHFAGDGASFIFERRETTAPPGYRRQD